MKMMVEVVSTKVTRKVVDMSIYDIEVVYENLGFFVDRGNVVVGKVASIVEQGDVVAGGIMISGLYPANADGTRKKHNPINLPQ